MQISSHPNGNTGFSQAYMFKPETDSKEEEEWIIQSSLQVYVSEW